jgi:hypothetical protein
VCARFQAFGQLRDVERSSDPLKLVDINGGFDKKAVGTRC